MMPTSELVDPAVRAFVDALNANDPAGVQAAMTANATMTDDGTPRQLGDWLEREAFDVHGRMDVTQQSPDGRDLLVDSPTRLPPPPVKGPLRGAVFNCDQWGTMATRWHFEVLDHRVAHFDTGQA
jgi:hypothetical protein